MDLQSIQIFFDIEDIRKSNEKIRFYIEHHSHGIAAEKSATAETVVSLSQN